MRWPWRKRRNGGDAAKARAEGEAKLKATRRATPHIEAVAGRLAAMPADEFAARLNAAFRRGE